VIRDALIVAHQQQANAHAQRVYTRDAAGRMATMPAVAVEARAVAAATVAELGRCRRYTRAQRRALNRARFAASPQLGDRLLRRAGLAL
jgi:hypothetical protein